MAIELPEFPGLGGMSWSAYRTKLLAWAKKDATTIPVDDCMDWSYDRISLEIQPAELDTEISLPAPDGLGGAEAQNMRASVWRHQLPNNFLHVIRITNNGRRLRRFQLDRVHEIGSSYEGNAPWAYCVVGQTVWIAPGVGGDLRLMYRFRDSKPADESETNWGLTYYPEAYIQCGLSYLWQYRENPEEANAAEGRYLSIRDRINNRADEFRQSQSGVAA